ncbi:MULTISPECIES: exodeoxyribonuclease III [unclassified Arsukibacterium]|uniref:exodeoxyribonuclease III n=1 Tax=unclassified Arsukibacterium TaxID=2635278 RepID=UPI000C40F6CA|nr:MULTISPECIES: exodeoxyribonuclease III [unclassified Arsukibacterium]MAA94757.1 exodeoxyribonuclease III [Rheinheimera sp.]MBM33885.1 exodeoxyribonuclease III [Rheinheimera sp.]|tara:strand:+ start:15672 stop:16487 length:816 start_codon:yes stop_codon:yes gene_type:complete
MKIISFNINGIRARLHQLQALIDKHQPDIIGLQEIKVHDDEFPMTQVMAMGYHVYHFGQKGHYGVAILSKQAATDMQYGFPGDAEDAQRRMLIGQYLLANGKTLTVLNGYFPQGENRSHPTKFPAKEKFYADLQHYIEQHHRPDDYLSVIGDINISPVDSDIGIGEANAKRWLREGKTSFLPEEREWLQRLKDWGLIDTYRHLYPDDNSQFSWFDYRSKGFNDNRGLRIDVVMATAPLTECCIESGIDYELRGIERPSDHAPVWSVFKLEK